MSGTSAAARAVAVYVSCADSGELHVLRLEGTTGALAPVEVHAPGGTMMPMALSPDGSRLYAARRSDPLEVLSYAVHPTTGALAAIGAAPLPDSMASIATDRSGRWLLAASYGGGIVSVSAIDANGVAAAAMQVVPVGAKTHAVKADPANQRVLATSLGEGIVRSFDFDAAHGRLVPSVGVPTFAPRPQASPRHLAHARDGRTVYLLGELDAAVDVVAIDPASGALRTAQTVSALPAGVDGAPWAADLHLTPDGRYLYASERRSSTVSGFRVDPETASLEPLGATPVEAEPRGFACTPDGRHLVVAGQASNHVGVWSIEPATGGLSFRGRHPCGRGPNWVELRAL